jgi:hypothetical protein
VRLGAKRRAARVAVDNGTADNEQRGIVQAKQDQMQTMRVNNDARWEKNYELLRDVTKHSLETLWKKDPVRAAGCSQTRVATYPLLTCLLHQKL